MPSLDPLAFIDKELELQHVRLGQLETQIQERLFWLLRFFLLQHIYAGLERSSTYYANTRATWEAEVAAWRLEQGQAREEIAALEDFRKRLSEHDPAALEAAGRFQNYCLKL